MPDVNRERDDLIRAERFVRNLHKSCQKHLEITVDHLCEVREELAAIKRAAGARPHENVTAVHVPAPKRAEAKADMESVADVPRH